MFMYLDLLADVTGSLVAEPRVNLNLGKSRIKKKVFCIFLLCLEKRPFHLLKLIQGFTGNKPIDIMLQLIEQHFQGCCGAVYSPKKSCCLLFCCKSYITLFL